jgi:hypothetical protein
MAVTSLTESLRKYNEYPSNLVSAVSTSQYRISQYAEQLKSREGTLFTSKLKDVLVDLFEHDDVDKRESDLFTVPTSL